LSSGSLVLGLLNGLTEGLLAVGLVLVYKANRFLNLAHAQLGALSALLLAKFVLDYHWNWWISLVLAVAIGATTGLLVDRFIIGKLRRKGGSPIRLLLLSVAVSQVLFGLTFVPDIGPSQAHASLYPQPFNSHVRIGLDVLTGMSILIAVLVPVLVLILTGFLRFSSLGKCIRAAANNPDAARLCGISVEKVSAVTWAIAGGLSALAAVMQAPTQPSFNVASLGPYLLMVTLGAAAFGAFISIPWALAGGVVLGLISQLTSAETSNGSDAELAVFVAILAVVLLRGRAIARVFSLFGGIGDNLPPTQVPLQLRSSPLVRYQRWWIAAGGILVALVFPKFPYFNTEGHRFLLVLVVIYALIGVGLTMLIGWAGQVSLGHFALVGLAAYLTARWSPHWSMPAIMLTAGLIGAAVMVLIGLPALRVGGLALAVTTMGFAVISADWLYHQSWVGSSQSFATINPIKLGTDLGTPHSMLSIYYVSLAVLVLGAASATALRLWGPGRLVTAVRDNEIAVSSFGLNAAALKLSILAVTGFFAAVAGVLWADAWRVVSSDQFTADLSISIIALPVIGGLGSISGAVLASVALYMSTFFIGPHISGIFGNFGNNLGFQLFLAGTGQIGILLAYPKGMAGAFQQQWQKYLNRRATLVDNWSAIRRVTDDESSPEPSHERPTALAGVRSQDPSREVEQAVLASDNGKFATRFERADAAVGGAVAPLLVTEGIRVHFGGVVALTDPDIEVNSGEIVGLIGPNGAGKTTLMNVISGVLKSTQGSVRMYGREIADLPIDFRAAYGISRTFQDATLFSGLTVIETIQVAMAYRHKTSFISAMVASPWARVEEWRTRQAAEGIAERFGLTPWACTLTSELSTGTRRICDLAAQFAARPRLLLLDEPTAGVAQREAEAFGPLLRRMREELDCSVLIVEHDMPLLMGLCDRVYAMETGQIIAEGTPERIRSNARVVQSYLGTSAAAVRRSGARSRAPIGPKRSVSR
jgi:ABC-type branched-subunit amino acid transport system ATPase component/ABC-type branched-subunit amino acid transport system permease subunit